MLRRTEQGKERDAEKAADQEPHCEARDHTWEQLLHLTHVEQPTGLSANEDEADLKRDREQHEQDRRHPDAARDEDRPRRGVQQGEDAETRGRDTNESRAPRRPGDERGRSRPDQGNCDVGRG